jgi:hypothetical protein
VIGRIAANAAVVSCAQLVSVAKLFEIAPAHEQLGQPRDVDGDPPRFVSGEPLHSLPPAASSSK